MWLKKQIKDSFLFVDIIDQKSLALLNRIAGRHYHRTRRKITIRRKDKSFQFWDKLIRTNKDVILGGK